MSELVSVVESESAKESLARGRICDEHPQQAKLIQSSLLPAKGLCHCQEHAREAKLIQSSLLPTKGLCHEAVEIAFRFMPFSEVGGDFVDFFGLPDGFIGIYLGDVVGKGLPAAMYAALVTGTLRGIHKSGTDTASVLARLNERLLQRPIRGRFCSTLYALFDPATRELIFSNAGMPLPLLVSGIACRQLGEGGLPRECSRALLTDGTSCNSAQETAFCSRPTVFMNCATGMESNSAPPKSRRFGHNAGTNRQPSRRISSSTARWPSPMAARRTMILLRWC